jgi:hypothetical protein
LRSLFQGGSVTYLATRDFFDLVSGNPDIVEAEETGEGKAVGEDTTTAVDVI